MKHLKKIMAVMLSIVIVITLIPQINFSVKAQESGGLQLPVHMIMRWLRQDILTLNGMKQQVKM